MITAIAAPLVAAIAVNFHHLLPVLGRGDTPIRLRD